MPIKLSTDRVLDYVPRLDERNLAHRVTAAPDLAGKSRYWTPGVILDQGQEGACVPHGIVGEALASPVRVKLPNAQAVAFEGYDWVRRNDEWPGEDYEGSSVNAGMKWGRSRGWWSGYKWALNMAELRTALETGPVVVGVEWRSGMYDAPGGIVTVGGEVVGGHCLVITGYTPRQSVLKVPAYRWLNSWGKTYGANGAANIRATDLDSILFKAGGEAAVALDRHL